MLEEALPLAIGVGAALLPAMAFGGLAAARAFMYLGAGETNMLYPSVQSQPGCARACARGGGGGQCECSPASCNDLAGFAAARANSCNREQAGTFARLASLLRVVPQGG
jgi:hypothetical protein